MTGLIEKDISSMKNTNVYRGNLSDDLLFGIVCYKYFYNNGQFNQSDFDSAYTDGSNDGGIDLIAVNENDFGKSMVLIQSKNVQALNSKDDIKDIFTKMAQTVSDFRSERIGSYNNRLRRIFSEKYDDAIDDSNFSIEMSLFLGFDKDEEHKEKIMQHLSKVVALEDFELSIFYKSEVEQQIESFADGKRFVPNGVVNIYKDHGIIRNGQNGILVDVSAISIRKLFDKYKDKGLFEQNFRYFIRNKKIDDQIHHSLKKDRDMFWFLNNGIIIGCKDFRIDGDNIKLDDFSIINGCQTTTILGKYKGSNEGYDFAIPCKIVKPDKSDDEDYFNLFISRIAEASNSQKPISDRDLKSNQPEQRKLQSLLKRDEPRVYLEIKRGEGILRRRNLKKWQKIKNDALGQLILAVILQQPGTARSSKRKIFSDKSTYNRIFKRTYDKATTVDLLKLSEFYDIYLQQVQLNEIATNVAKNGKYAILAIIGFLLKHRRGQIDLSLDTSSKSWISDITVDNLSGEILDPNRPDDFIKPLFSVFTAIVMTLSSLYKSREESESSVTNFFKTDKKYYSIIMDRIKSGIILDEYEYEKMKEKLDKVFI